MNLEQRTGLLEQEADILVPRLHSPSVDLPRAEHRDLWMALVQVSQVRARSSGIGHSSGPEQGPGWEGTIFLSRGPRAS